MFYRYNDLAALPEIINSNVYIICLIVKYLKYILLIIYLRIKYENDKKGEV